MLIGRRLADSTLTSEPPSLTTSTAIPPSKTTINDASNPQQGVGVSRSSGHDSSLASSPPIASLYKPHSPSSRSVSITFREYCVSYSDIMRDVPEVHRKEEWDVVLHLGVAMGYQECTIETGSDRLNYDMIHPDVDGRFPPPVPGGYGLEGSVDRWNAVIDTKDLLEYLKRKGVQHLRESADPGGYMCGYSYATSLKWSEIVASEKGGAAARKPVLFVHVPGLLDNSQGPYTLDELCYIIQSICWWLGQSTL